MAMNIAATGFSAEPLAAHQGRDRNSARNERQHAHIRPGERRTGQRSRHHRFPHRHHAYESQSPIVTVGTGDDRKPLNFTGIESTLNQLLPQFTVAASRRRTARLHTLPSPTATPGAATVNLRNLGTNRNLVLVDGRRVQPINGSLAVDLNTIPSAAIRDVEVISGGAAAVTVPTPSRAWSTSSRRRTSRARNSTRPTASRRKGTGRSISSAHCSGRTTPTAAAT